MEKQTNKDKIFNLQTCLLCKSTALKPAIRLAKNPVGDRFHRDREVARGCELHEVQVMLCLECGHMQLSQIVEPKEIYTHEYLYHTSTSVGLVSHFQKSAQAIIDRFGLDAQSFVIEIGSNEGAMLKAFQDAGLSVLGIDPAHQAAQMATKSGVETWCEFFGPECAQKIIAQRGQANIVIANNVIANIPQLEAIIKAIALLLKPNGVFIFESSYASAVIQNHLIDTIYHEHISYFSLKPLEKFFSSCGLELFDAEEIWTKGGSVRGFVSKPLAFAKTQRLGEILQKEEECIFASHIVANSHDLETLFLRIEALLSKEGVFVFESFYAKALFERGLVDMIFHEHLSYLYLIPLESFLQTRGYHIFDARLIESKGGSIQIHIAPPNRPKTKRCEELLALEREFLMSKDLVFESFLQSLSRLKKEVIRFARELKAKQGVVPVYGASVGGVMMVYHLGLAEYIDYFLDDNPSKIGTYCPNLAVLVRNSSYLNENWRIKKVISVAWRFMDSITQRHQAFLERGGEFYSINLQESKLKRFGFGKNIFIFGGSKGIGSVFTRRCQYKDYQNIALFARSNPYLLEADFYATDFCHQEAFLECLNEAKEKYKTIHQLVFFQKFRGGEREGVELSAWEGELQVELECIKNTIAALKNHLSKDASIVLVSSVCAHLIAKNQPLGYHVAKAGLEQMARYYAMSLGHLGIRVNAIAPSLTLKPENQDFYAKEPKLTELYSNLSPLKRMATSDDVCEVIEFLLEVNYMTGQTLRVDGGVSLQEYESLMRHTIEAHTKQNLQITPNLAGGGGKQA